MSAQSQPPLFGPPVDGLPPDPMPERGLADRPCRVYVASALTRLKHSPAELARMVECEIDAIQSALDGPRLDGGVDLTVEPYAPIEHSSAHRHADLTAQEVFRRNSLQVLTRSDGLIVHGWEPGAGVGQEFTWAATQVAIPVLWVHHGDGMSVSRQILGTPGDVEFRVFDGPGELRQLIEQWLRSRKALLAAGPYRRSTRSDRWRGPATAARTRWQALEESEQHRISAGGNITPDVIEFYLSDPLLLAVAPAWVLDVLSVEGLLAATSATRNQLGRLTTPQLLALAEAGAEYQWDNGLIDQLRIRAEQLLAEPATRRLRLDSPGDWHRFLRGLKA